MMSFSGHHQSPQKLTATINFYIWDRFNIIVLLLLISVGFNGKIIQMKTPVDCNKAKILQNPWISVY